MNKILVLLALTLAILTSCADVHDHIHEHSVEIEGKDLKILKVREVAELWNIDANVFLDEIIKEFDLIGNYTIETVIDDMRIEYKFSPALIKDIAENIKSRSELTKDDSNE